MNMRKGWRLTAYLLTPLIGLLLSGAAHATWTLIGRTEILRVYLDDKRIQRQGDFVRVLQLTDYAVAQWVDPRTAIGSIRHEIEYDCSGRRFRFLSATAFSEQMEVGSLVASETLSDPEWLLIEPNSTAEAIEKVICGKD